MCVCDAGYHVADDLTCEANVVGAERSGVDCGGHGTCVVVEGDPAYPLCLCDDGFVATGTTSCLADAVPVPASTVAGTACTWC